MSILQTVKSAARRLYPQFHSHLPGDIGQGGYGSGQDPDNPKIMHYGDTKALPRFDPSAIRAGKYAGPKFQEPAYNGPTFGSLGQSEGMDLEGDGTQQETAPTNTSPTSDPYTDALTYYQQLLSSPLAHISRGRSALEMLRMPVHPTDNLGNVAGQRLAQLLTGLISKKSGAQLIRNRELEQAGQQVSIEGARVKAQRDAEKGAADVEATKALAAQRRRVKTDYRKDAQGRLVIPDPADPTKVRYVTDESGKVLDPKFERPFTIPYLMSDGVSYGTAQYDNVTDSYKPVAVGGAAVVGKQAQPVLTEGPNKGRTPEQVAQDTQKDLDRKSREKVAAEYAALQGQRNSLSAAEFNQRTSQFKATHPGYGKPALKRSEIEDEQKRENAEASRQGRQPRNLRKEAVEQGYEIDDEN